MELLYVMLIAMGCIVFQTCCAQEKQFVHAWDWDGHISVVNKVKGIPKSMSQLRCSILCNQETTCDYFFHSKQLCQLHKGELKYLGDVVDPISFKTESGAKAFVQSNNKCTASIPHSPYNATLCKTSTQRMNYQQAFDYCNSINCRMAEVRNKADVDAKIPTIKTTFGSNVDRNSTVGFWVGLQYSDICHNFVWSSDKSILNLDDSVIVYKDEPSKLKQSLQSGAGNNNCGLFSPYYEYKLANQVCGQPFLPLCDCE